MNIKHSKHNELRGSKVRYSIKNDKLYRYHEIENWEVGGLKKRITNFSGQIYIGESYPKKKENASKVDPNSSYRPGSSPRFWEE